MSESAEKGDWGLCWIHSGHRINHHPSIINHFSGRQQQSGKLGIMQHAGKSCQSCHGCFSRDLDAQHAARWGEMEESEW
jgi:hypothetical protein